MYDAVWTNVGDRIHWGIPYIFRVVFDDNHYTAFVNDEPVLYRALTDVYANASLWRFIEWELLLIGNGETVRAVASDNSLRKDNSDSP